MAYLNHLVLLDIMCYYIIIIVIVVIIIIIIILTGKTALFDPEHSSVKVLPDCIRFSLDFASVIFLQSKDVSLASDPNVGDQVSVYMFRSARVAQLYPQALGSLFVAFYDSQGYGGDILTRLHTGFYIKHILLLTVRN
jgi:hypothetical protein